MKTVSAAILLALSLNLAGPVAARAGNDPAKDQLLNQLFQTLKAARSEGQGAQIEQAIVSVWLDSGDAKINEQMDWAIAAMGASAYSLALNYLDSIVLNKPDYVEGWNKRATVYYIIGRYQESLSDIDRTLALEPRHFGAIAGKGMVDLQLGDNQGALDAFKQALAIDPQLTDIQLEVIRLESKLGIKI